MKANRSPTQNSHGAVAGTASFSKFMRVLDAIAADAHKSISINDLHKSTGYPKPTLYRIVDALVSEQLIVAKDAQTFGLGPRLITLASVALETSDIRQLCREQLQGLRDLTQETIHLAVRVGNAMTYIDKLESPHAVRMNSRLGSQVTLYSSSVGKAYIAALDEAQRNSLVHAIEFTRFTDSTLASADALLTESAQIEEQGYSEDREENEKDIFCYGCAIRDKNGHPVACISISIPLFRINEDRERAYIRPLIDTCNAISKKMRLVDFNA